ncbi:hypothetical protein [Qipengyuania vesicularis]|uniref:hypothetical protein n=1 Tax=Qipengyuania vesicularis TaxID=2867232 RepID=UPI001C88769D|nr:hypothetical protein [Qipengyuania vesicularis]MBX7527593.1 hypothetical protein [Qipengyuania vesicularis]
MIGKIIGAYAGDKLAKKVDGFGIGGAGGAALGVVAASVLRRMSLPAMLALGAGGYVAKKILDKKGNESAPVEEDATAETSTRKAKAA